MNNFPKTSSLIFFSSIYQHTTNLKAFSEAIKLPNYLRSKRQMMIVVILSLEPPNQAYNKPNSYSAVVRVPIKVLEMVSTYIIYTIIRIFKLHVKCLRDV